MTESNFYERLNRVQTDLNAPKGQYNDFSNFNYRSVEDIYEAVKPLNKANRLNLKVSDKMVQIGDRFYIEATATLRDLDNPEIKEVVTAYAREAKIKKGMDDSQITGSTSSYARKYALNGLYLIDDTKDADTNAYQEKINKAVEQEKKEEEKFIERRDQLAERVTKLADSTKQTFQKVYETILERASEDLGVEQKELTKDNIVIFEKKLYLAEEKFKKYSAKQAEENEQQSILKGNTTQTNNGGN